MATQTTATAQAALAIAAAQAAFAAGTAAAAPPVVDLATEDAARAQAEEASVGSTSTEIFTNYAPSHSSVPGGPHPGDVAEAASLAATDAPACTYELAPVLIDGDHLLGTASFHLQSKQPITAANIENSFAFQRQALQNFQRPCLTR